MFYVALLHDSSILQDILSYGENIRGYISSGVKLPAFCGVGNKKGVRRWARIFLRAASCATPAAPRLGEEPSGNGANLRRRNRSGESFSDCPGADRWHYCCHSAFAQALDACGWDSIWAARRPSSGGHHRQISRLDCGMCTLLPYGPHWVASRKANRSASASLLSSASSPDGITDTVPGRISSISPRRIRT